MKQMKLWKIIVPAFSILMFAIGGAASITACNRGPKLQVGELKANGSTAPMTVPKNGTMTLTVNIENAVGDARLEIVGEGNWIGITGDRIAKVQMGLATFVLTNNVATEKTLSINVLNHGVSSTNTIVAKFILTEPQALNVMTNNATFQTIDLNTLGLTGYSSPDILQIINGVSTAPQTTKIVFNFNVVPNFHSIVVNFGTTTGINPYYDRWNDSNSIVNPINSETVTWDLARKTISFSFVYSVDSILGLGTMSSLIGGTYY